MKWLEGKPSSPSPPSHDYISRSSRSSDWPGGHDGASKPPGSRHDSADGHSREQFGSSDRSSGVVVTVHDGPTASLWPPDEDNKGLSLDDWHQMYCGEETKLSQMQIPASVACAVK